MAQALMTQNESMGANRIIAGYDSFALRNNSAKREKIEINPAGKQKKSGQKTTGKTKKVVYRMLK